MSTYSLTKKTLYKILYGSKNEFSSYNWRGSRKYFLRPNVLDQLSFLGCTSYSQHIRLISFFSKKYLSYFILHLLFSLFSPLLFPSLILYSLHFNYLNINSLNHVPKRSESNTPGRRK